MIDHRTQRRMVRREVGESTVAELQAMGQSGDADLSFSDLIESLPVLFENNEMAQSMTIHTTFVCLLHLGNEHKLLMKQIAPDPRVLDVRNTCDDFNIFIEVL